MDTSSLASMEHCSSECCTPIVGLVGSAASPLSGTVSTTVSVRRWWSDRRRYPAVTFAPGGPASSSGRRAPAPGHFRHGELELRSALQQAREEHRVQCVERKVREVETSRVRPVVCAVQREREQRQRAAVAARSDLASSMGRTKPRGKPRGNEERGAAASPGPAGNHPKCGLPRAPLRKPRRPTPGKNPGARAAVVPHRSPYKSEPPGALQAPGGSEEPLVGLASRCAIRASRLRRSLPSRRSLPRRHLR